MAGCELGRRHRVGGEADTLIGIERRPGHRICDHIHGLHRGDGGRCDRTGGDGGVLAGGYGRTGQIVGVDGHVLLRGHRGSGDRVGRDIGALAGGHRGAGEGVGGQGHIGPGHRAAERAGHRELDAAGGVDRARGVAAHEALHLAARVQGVGREHLVADQGRPEVAGDVHGLGPEVAPTNGQVVQAERLCADVLQQDVAVESRAPGARSRRQRQALAVAGGAEDRSGHGDVARSTGLGGVQGRGGGRQGQVTAEGQAVGVVSPSGQGRVAGDLNGAQAAAGAHGAQRNRTGPRVER